MTTLTGRTRFRPYCTDDMVMLVLQVEVVERRPLPNNFAIYVTHGWRDATVEDLCEVQHLTYSNINLTANVQLPDVPDALPGEARPPRGKLH